jgi:aspartyl aminopeptidase
MNNVYIGISGQVLVRSQSGKVARRLVKIDRPIARVSNLAIHLTSAEERAAFKINKEEHLSPIIAGSILEKGATDQLTGDTKSSSWAEGHEPVLLELLAEELKVDVKDICDFDLHLFDIQPATLAGCRSEFVYSGRLDNLATCFVAIESLISYSDSASFSTDSDISLVALFDHEEVGSVSAQGAASPIILKALQRISAALCTSNDNSSITSDWYASTLRKSYMISADQAHAQHPNYSSKHEKVHAPQINSGIVLKNNCNQRYTTNSVTRFILREICAMENLPVQEFVVRQDCGCGSTV